MKETRYFCDRCKIELLTKFFSWKQKKDFAERLTVYNTKNISNVLLCMKCSEDFETWLNSKQ